MPIEVTVTVPTGLIEEAARAAIEEVFRAPTRGGYRGGSGWEMLKGQVQAFLEGQDVADAIAKEAKIQLRDVVGHVVEEELKLFVRRKAREMARRGELFDTEEDRNA